MGSLVPYSDSDSFDEDVDSLLEAELLASPMPTVDQETLELLDSLPVNPAVGNTAAGDYILGNLFIISNYFSVLKLTLSLPPSLMLMEITHQLIG